MKILFLFVGKTTDTFVKDGMDVFSKRLKNYLQFKEEIVPAGKSITKPKVILEESDAILAKTLPGDFVVLLDENGIELTSRQFSGLIEKWMVQGVQRLVFVTGGAFGVSEEIKKRANYILAASKFTFTHQMIRLILLEQVYRAMTISKNEKYHHD